MFEERRMLIVSYAYDTISVSEKVVPAYSMMSAC